MQYKYSSLPVEMKFGKPSSKAWIAQDFSTFLCIHQGEVSLLRAAYFFDKHWQFEFKRGIYFSSMVTDSFQGWRFRFVFVLFLFFFNFLVELNL